MANLEDAGPPVPTAPISVSKKRKPAVSEIEVDLSLPEPPSKKARRLLKKGKPLPARRPRSDDNNDNDEAGGDDDDEAGGGGGKSQKKDKEKERSPHGVWIGNLPWSVTKAELRRWLVASAGGAITDEGITRLHLPTSAPEKPARRVGGRRRDESDAKDGGAGPELEPDPAEKPGRRNKGFAYVDFATFEASVAAVALSETELGGRKLLIKDSKSFDGRPAAPQPRDAEKDAEEAPNTAAAAGAAAGAAGASTKVFVGNLGFSTTEDDLRDLFDRCGPIRWVKVATFEDTGKCKGYGWVNFQEAEAAAWAVKGFVKVREAIETVEDFMDEGEPAVPSELVRSTKTRKWWVNQLHGRTLKVELAEDDKVRYKKRFGRDGVHPGGKRQQQQRQQQQQPKCPAAVDNPQKPAGRAGEEQSAAAPASVAHKWTEEGSAGPARPKKLSTTKTFSYHQDMAQARLMGAAVAPQGVKTSLE